MLYHTQKILKSLLLIAVVIGLLGCEITGRKHGTRSNQDANATKATSSSSSKSFHKYFYYPNTYVYYDVQRKIYFYKSGKYWQVNPKLPKRLKTSNYRIRIKMKSSKPYLSNNSHRKKYPKKVNKKKNSNKHAKIEVKKSVSTKEKETDTGKMYIEYKKNVTYE